MPKSMGNGTPALTGTAKITQRNKPAAQRSLAHLRGEHRTPRSLQIQDPEQATSGNSQARSPKPKQPACPRQQSLQVVKGQLSHNTGYSEVRFQDWAQRMNHRYCVHPDRSWGAGRAKNKGEQERPERQRVHGQAHRVLDLGVSAPPSLTDRPS